MLGNSNLLNALQLSQYAEILKMKSDKEFVEEVRTQIYEAGFSDRYSQHDQKATECHEEANRRQKPWLYQRGYNSALKDAGGRVSAFDLERATEAYYQKSEK